jgi:hypothetical protein
MPKTPSGGFNRFTSAADALGDLTVVNPDGSTVGGGGTSASPTVVRLQAAGSAVQAVVSAAGELIVADDGVSSTAIPAATAANTVLKATAGRLCRVLVTALGTGAVVVFDNSTTNAGKIIGLVAASAPAGTMVDFSMPASAGITVQGDPALPAITVSWT